MSTRVQIQTNCTAPAARGRDKPAPQKRRLAIEAAEALFASRGYHQTSIADISEASGVHRASIFQYFKTKESLLVSIPERHLEKTLDGITEHLQGIRGAESKLRKLMWHHLRDLSLNRAYTSILLLELRTLPALYHSPAYDMICRYRSFATEAIREGIRDGDVDPTIEPILVLDMIFGAIDSVALRWLFFDRPYNPSVVAEELCSLVKSAIWRRKETPHHKNGDEPSRSETTRRIILEAASQVFGAKGYGGATVSEIARRAGFSEATIYQYFRSKDHLLLSVPGNWFEELVDELKRGFSGPPDPAEQLLYLLRRWALDFQIREWDTRILILQLYRNRAFSNSQAYRNTHRFWNLVRSVVEEGRKTGVFRSDFKIPYYLHLVQGTFEHEALARMVLSKGEPTAKRTEQMIELLLRAIRA